MTKAITITYSTIHRYRERIFVALAVAIFASIFSYIFLLQKAIVNVVEREKMMETINKKSSEVGDLEAKYFSVKNSFTPELAYSKGFKDANVTTYISQKKVTAMASNNEL